MRRAKLRSELFMEWGFSPSCSTTVKCYFANKNGVLSSQYAMTRMPAGVSRMERKKARRCCHQAGSAQGLVACLALGQRLDLARRRTGEQLAWTADLVLGVADHFIELGDPADGAGQREDRGEQRHGLRQSTSRANCRRRRTANRNRRSRARFRGRSQRRWRRS